MILIEPLRAERKRSKGRWRDAQGQVIGGEAEDRGTEDRAVEMKGRRSAGRVTKGIWDQARPSVRVSKPA